MKIPSHRQLMMALGLTLAIFCLAEGVARSRFVPHQVQTDGIFEYDPHKVFRLKANHKGHYVNQPVQTNAWGHRDEAVEQTAPAETLRVLVLGDSISFGHGVKAEESWPELLEALVSRPGRRVEVINTAAPGNGPMQEYHDLRRNRSLAPDVVVLQITLNDVVEPYLFLKRLGGNGRDYHGVEDGSHLHHVLQQRSGLYLALRQGLVFLRLLGSPGKTRSERAAHEETYAATKLIDAPDSPPIEAAWAEALGWLDRIARAAGDTPVLLVVSPFQFQLKRSPALALPQERLKAFSSEAGWDFIDLLSLLQTRYVASQGGPPWEVEQPLAERIVQLRGRNADSFDVFWRRYFLDHDHYNRAGHVLVAEHLAPEVERLLTR
jgi:lysophospholipase L1-like esterase